jgi:predicted thioesterase
MAMENAALNAIKPYFEAGESAVGTRVDVSHLAATPVGRRVVAFAEVTGLSAVSSSSGPRNGWIRNGRGTHGRIVIDLRKFTERLAVKVAATGSCIGHRVDKLTARPQRWAIFGSSPASISS